jgi:hypothetical protein
VVLSARDRTRYARHLLLAQLGEAGQERLLAAHVRANVDADPGALAVARRYLTRAGVHVDDASSAVQAPELASQPEPPELRVQAQQARARFPLQVATSQRLATLAGAPALREAARALAGALSAVNTLQSILGVQGSTLSGAPVDPQIFFAISSEEA